MKNFDLFRMILKQTGMSKFLLSFLMVYFAGCILVWIFDPDITSLGDALWFGFMVVTTIGFGDITVTSLAARLVTVVLGLYGVLAIGFICGVGASWLFEVVRSGHDESVAKILWQLEHLDSLSDEEVSALKNKLETQSKQPAAGLKQSEHMPIK